MTDIWLLFGVVVGGGTFQTCLTTTIFKTSLHTVPVLKFCSLVAELSVLSHTDSFDWL